ncbi:MAG TPA: hypothetical protein VLL52_01050 [Anaerolineae bacterium]|nr:hypothetical protein [Anaerolineae bacterium]
MDKKSIQGGSNEGYDLKQLLPELIKIVPEVEEPYLAEVNRSKAFHESPEQQQLAEIRALRGKPAKKPYEPGMYIVFEAYLMPQFIKFVQNNEKKRVAAVFDWIERLANSEHKDVVGLVEIAVCEALVTNYGRYFSQIYPYLGKETIKLCRGVARGFKISSEIKALLKIK